ncbi:hypothetical protein NW754_013157 [Fusarium falciforme]|uniref:Uncharacterized protein n=1 Tax=Fusarium falciforme TaxID=195108 RepID=A0A9W8QUR9_9HYPO|nr:Hypothetical protein NCS54_01326800 [Fusarium falciforme]KAJ4171388.1 hypothetical protein NW754_013157 [Fusarium falciforme]KAJ4179634.1 hypothetical protein NW755_012359 [Fusarium falciforme]KAJ4199888.1 hypothetical protein NW767_007868 [Fusarium falciforme]KAJ4244309.1 hypothetical protein NW757_010668 [Fusarium falciforme]WAO95634.1 Hypothetical protein NCS54_01326800 [Fusarium falciforme]
MSNKYTIIINNRTGSPQNYNLFSEKPDIVGVVKSSIWSNIYQVAEATPDGAIAQFEMWKRYYAIVGTWRGGEKAGAKVSITQTRGVTLGTKAGDDSDVPGTTLNMSVVNGVTPSFEKAPAESSAWNNAYEVDTGNDFTLDVATERNFFIGLASSPDGASSVPTATFKPEPGNQYQIQPVNTYYVTYGSVFQVGELLDVAKLPKKPLAVDFTVRGPAVVINHNPDGKLVIAK